MALEEPCRFFFASVEGMGSQWHIFYETILSHFVDLPLLEFEVDRRCGDRIIVVSVCRLIVLRAASLMIHPLQ